MEERHDPDAARGQIVDVVTARPDAVIDECGRGRGRAIDLVLALAFDGDFDPIVERRPSARPQ